MTRVLVVEDSRTQAEVAREILEEAGYEVEVAGNGQVALERVSADSFDLIVSDVMMPLMSGYELCRAIKSNPATKHLPVILLTTLNDPMDIIQGLESGADNFVTKPYSPGYLVERVATLLENKALRIGKSKVSVEIMFLGRRFTISSDKEQILDLLIATFEDMVRTNYSLQATQRELSEAKAKIEQYVQALEGRVHRSEEKYRALMDQAPDSIMVFGTDGVLREFNQRVTELFCGDALAGRHIGAITSPGLAERFAAFVETGAQGEDEIEIRNPDGTPKQVEYALSFSDVGDERVVVAVMRDVTERRKLERDFHEAQKFAAVARLASGAAHDFNNVLMAIGAYAEFLVRQLPAGDPSHRAAEQVRNAAKRGSWLTGQLLAFTRGRTSVDEIADVNAVIRGFADMLQQLAGKDVQFVFHLQQDPALVNLEPGRVEQIVMNLVVNARDAMDGRGVIAIATTSLVIERADEAPVAELTPGCYVVLTVADSGHGMTADTLQNLFKPLFTTKSRGQGTGLGLAIVQTIVLESGGQIDVDSEPGKGTKFTVYLRSADEKTRASRPFDSAALAELALCALSATSASI